MTGPSRPAETGLHKTRRTAQRASIVGTGPSISIPVPLREHEHVLHRRRTIGRECRRRPREPLHHAAGRVDTERHGVLRGLVADRVRGVAGHRHRLPDAGHLAPRPPVGVRDVEGQFPGEHPVDLAGRVPVHHRWAAARRHPQFDGEQIAAGVAPVRRAR